MQLTHNFTRPPIAVVGVSALFPGSDNSAGFWTDILSGTDRITDVPASHWLIDDHYDPDMMASDKTYGRRGGFLDSTDLDLLKFGIPPVAVSSTDTAQLLALVVAQRVLDDAVSGQFTELDRSRVSVILGVTSGQELLGAMASRMNRPMWLQGMRRAGVPEDIAQSACDQIANLHPEWQESTFPGLLGNVVAGRIANRLDLGGTNCVTDAACASSFSALSMGVNELYLGDSDLVIAGGVDTMNDIFMYMCFSKTPALSQTEDIRPFSDNADGTMLGEGIGMFALKRLEDAERDGNHIYSVINAVGASSDGRSKSVYAPVSEGQARALANTYSKAGYQPETVELVEAHGTGTVAGDAAEFRGLELAFNASGQADRQWCALGSVKSQIGHTKAAAGAAGLFKVIMALHHKVLPLTAKIDTPNPKLDLEASPFYLNTTTRPWIRPSDHERRGSVSSFGFGGSNFHVALSEYTGSGIRAQRLRSNNAELVILTGPDGQSIVTQAKEHLDACSGKGYLQWLAYTTQNSYTPTEQARLAIVARDSNDFETRLRTAIERITADPLSAFSTPTKVYYGVGAHTGDIAFIFPGQGSQYVDMGAGLATRFDEAIAPWNTAADYKWDSNTLQSVVFPATDFSPTARAKQEAMLTETQWAQPAIGVTSLSYLRVLQQIGLKATHVAGHSFGEITALHAAGVLSEADTVRVARHRGELMADAAKTPGAMTAVAGTFDDVSTLLKQSGHDVVIANHNHHQQVVLSGPTAAIDAIEADLDSAKLTYKRLPVATAFHSSVVSSASKTFTKSLDSIPFTQSEIAVYGNEKASLYPDSDAAARKQLGRQLAKPVRFVEMIQAMYNNGARTFVEVGPGSTLTGLVDRILDDEPHAAIALDKKKSTGLESFLDGLAQLAARGVAMNPGALWQEYVAVENPSEITAPALTVAINGANHGKPYPPEDLTQLVGPNPPGKDIPMPSGDSAPVTPQAPPTTNSTSDRSQTMHTKTPASTSIPANLSTNSEAPGNAILNAYQSAQQHTAQAHAEYLRSTAAAHTAFMSASQQSLAALGQLAGVSDLASFNIPASAPVPHSAPITAAPVTTYAPAPVSASPNLTTTAAVAPPSTKTTPSPVKTPSPVTATSSSIATTSLPVAATPSTNTQTMTSDELMALLLTTVADKTGYPPDMLTMQMELEGDLGIDSIKRVEILSAMQEKIPTLPEVDTSVMAQLITLGQIVDYMLSQINAADNTPGEAAAIANSADITPAATASESAAQSPTSDELMSLLLTTVADKTGYPPDMLTMEMELEGDLGIDSIKRVEILSAMQEKIPTLPEVDTSVMAQLITLGQIVDYMFDQLKGGDNNDTRPFDQGAVAPSACTAAPLGRFKLRSVASKSSGEPLTGLLDATIGVIDDNTGVAAALTRLLVAAGVTASVVDKVDDSLDGIIFLGGLRPIASIEDGIAINREAFAIARSLATGSKAARVLVTVSNLGGDFGVTAPCNLYAWSAGLTGLIRTTAIEWPDTRVRAIDIERADTDTDALAALIADELLTGGNELEVGLAANGTRTTLRSELAAVSPGTTPLGSSDVVVVSGGGRGVTAATMIELARSSGAKLALLGRSELTDEPACCSTATDDAALKKVLLTEAKASGKSITPRELATQARQILATREVRQTLSAIEATGCQACYLAVNITDNKAVTAALNKVRAELGPITAVVHGAGVLADKLIADKTDAAFASVFDTKVLGLQVLLNATRNDALKVLCVFSSVAARTGNRGQVDYAMANEILNKVAVAERNRRGADCVVKSFGWGPWDGGMVSPSLKAHFEAMGTTLIPLEAGSRMLVEELSDLQNDEVELVIGGGVLPECILASGHS